MVPYGVGKESLQTIRDTYKTLAMGGRLLIPGQVAREFAKNRSTKLAELHQQLQRKMNRASSLQKGRYPLLEDLESYQAINALEEKIDHLLKQYRDAIKAVLDDIRNWAWDDPVSILYAELFTESVIFDLDLKDKSSIREDLDRRKRHSIPPGYKDAGKDDQGIGDLLIWWTILEIGKERKKDLIFVSGDEKSEWWQRSEAKGLYPRFELVDEYRRRSGGHSFHIVSFSDFLDLYGASETVVEEVGGQEANISAERRDFSERFFLIGPRGADAEAEVREGGDIVVKKDSKAAGTVVPSTPEYVIRLREELEEDGILRKTEDSLLFLRDQHFASASAAASVVLGRSANGRIEWINSDGVILKESKVYKQITS